MFLSPLPTVAFLVMAVPVLMAKPPPSRMERYGALMERMALKMDRMELKLDNLTTSLLENTRRLSVVEGSLNLTQEELVSKFSREEQYNLQMTAHFNELENLKLSIGRCSTKHQINSFHELLATDECEINTHNCSIYATCRDSPIYFECSCIAGYAGDGVTCEDIDECSVENKCHEHASCTNTHGSFTCQCLAGYVGDGYTCNDVDECSDDLNICPENELCANYLGRYSCTGVCPEGFQIKGKTCEDIDECSMKTKCSAHATCTNTRGSFTCQCSPGREGDGYKCRPNGFVCTSPSFEIQPFGCVSYVAGQMTWSEAQTKCNAVGGSLLHGFTKQHLLTIKQLVNQRYSGSVTSPWLGVRGGLFVKSSSDDGPGSSPDDDIWRWGNIGRVGDNTQCGSVDLYVSDPALYHTSCSQDLGRRPYLCQILY